MYMYMCMYRSTIMAISLSDCSRSHCELLVMSFQMPYISFGSILTYIHTYIYINMFIRVAVVLAGGLVLLHLVNVISQQ